LVLLASAYDQSRFLKTENVPTEKKFRIKAVTEEEVGVGKDKEKKLVVWFTNDEHGLVLNKTNNRTIRGAFGDPVSGWINKIIIVFPTMAEFRGTMKPALRVRIPAPKGNGQPVAAKAPEPKPPFVPAHAADDELDDEINF
jgi:hypothetical protein